MSRVDFKARVLSYHADSPQRKMEVELALNGLFESLDTLARLGHVLTVKQADETAYAGEEWPKMMYHDQFAPEGKVFHEGQVPTESGWRETPVVPEQQEGQEERPKDEDLGAKPTPEQRAEYPKKLYHEDHPGGISVMNADMERDYVERGWSTEPQDRDWKPPSASLEEERKGPGSVKQIDQTKRPNVAAKKETK